MKKYTRRFGILLGVSLLLLIAFHIFNSPVERRRQPTPNALAARYAVQAALKYSREHGDVLPEKLDSEWIRQATPDRYKRIVPVHKVIYMPPDDKRVSSLSENTILAIVPHEQGVHVGFASGFTRFYSIGHKVLPGDQQIDDENAEPPGDERMQ